MTALEQLALGAAAALHVPVYAKWLLGSVANLAFQKGGPNMPDPSKILTDDAVKLAEGLAQAYVSGSATVALDAMEVAVAGKSLTVTPTLVVSVK